MSLRMQWISTSKFVADGSALVFNSSDVRSRLWEISAKGRTPKLLTVGEGAIFISVARTVSRLAYCNEWLTPNDIWRVGGPTSKDPEARSKLISSASYDYQATYSPDGSRIAFVSWRSGESAIWVCESATVRVHAGIRLARTATLVATRRRNGCLLQPAGRQHGRLLGRCGR